jgi:hypothetical protein
VALTFPRFCERYGIAADEKELLHEMIVFDLARAIRDEEFKSLGSRVDVLKMLGGELNCSKNFVDLVIRNITLAAAARDGANTQVSHIRRRYSYRMGHAITRFIPVSVRDRLLSLKRMLVSLSDRNARATMFDFIMGPYNSHEILGSKLRVPFFKERGICKTVSKRACLLIEGLIRQLIKQTFP